MLEKNNRNKKFFKTQPRFSSNSIALRTFRTHYDYYEFLVMSFELKINTTTLMDR